MKTVSPSPAEIDLKLYFDLYDTARKGYLTREEFRKFCDYLMNHIMVNKTAMYGLMRDLDRIKGTISYGMLYEAWKRQMLIKSAAEQDSPAVKLVLLLKEIAALDGPTKPMRNSIDWCLEKLASGKIYETPLDNAYNYGKPSKQLSEILPRLNTPGIVFKDLEGYKPIIENKGIVPSITPSFDKKLLESFGFSVFDFTKSLDRKAVLPTVSYHLFQTYGVFSVLDETSFKRFVQKIQSGYNTENPFHNDLHITDVLQMCHCVLTNGGVAGIMQLSKMDIAAFLVSMVIHDYKHPALGNGFFAATGHELAIQYNDQSILENFHLSQAFEVIFKEPGCNIFCKRTPDEVKYMRKRIIESVLSTDMAKHNTIMNSLQTLITTHNIVKGSNNEKILDNKKAEFETKQLIMNAFVHAIDIGNQARPFEVAQLWSTRVMEEFWKQGDLEKQLKIPVSMCCNRSTDTKPAVQSGFICNIVKPLFERLAQIFPKLEILAENARKNEQEWRQLLPPASPKKESTTK